VGDGPVPAACRFTGSGPNGCDIRGFLPGSFTHMRIPAASAVRAAGSSWEGTVD